MKRQVQQLIFLKYLNAPITQDRSARIRNRVGDYVF